MNAACTRFSPRSLLIHASQSYNHSSRIRAISEIRGCLFSPTPASQTPQSPLLQKASHVRFCNTTKEQASLGCLLRGFPRLACCGVQSVFQRRLTGRGVNRRKLLPLNRLRTSSHASFRRPLAKLFSVSAPVSRVPARLTAACLGGFGNHSNATTVPKPLGPLLRWSVISCWSLEAYASTPTTSRMNARPRIAREMDQTRTRKSTDLTL